MSFTSILFIPFMIVCIMGVSILSLITRNKDKNNNIVFLFIILCSFVFICMYNIISLIVLLLVSLVSYACGILIEKNDERTKKALLIIAIVLLTLLLVLFKYLVWAKSQTTYFDFDNSILEKIVLPVGISFYIFTSIGYLADIYSGKYKAEHNLIYILMMICFFPKIVAGPIVRGDDFLPQLHSYKGITKEGFAEGIQIFCIGAFKKLVMANRMDIFVNDVYRSPAAYDSQTVMLAIISYSFQIYLDFSGYSDMAIGIARILGIDIKPNFDFPYVSSGSSEFWQRWHISLSSWLRDYIYYPLGGSRKGKYRTYINLIVVMVISGMWHGFGPTFLVWGLLHGVWACIDRIIRSGSKAADCPSKVMTAVWKVCSAIFSFVIASILWVFFRAETLETAVTVLTRAVSRQNGIHQPYVWSYISIALVIIVLIYEIIISHGKELHGKYHLQNLETIHGLTVFFVFAGVTLLFAYFGNTAFIYDAF